MNPNDMQNLINAQQRAIRSVGLCESSRGAAKKSWMALAEPIRYW